MNFFPFENLKIDTSFTKREIKNAIANNSTWNEELGMRFKKNTSKNYEGYVTDNKFKIRRILKSGFNSFIPIATGIVTEKENGCQIEIKLRLHKIIMLMIIGITLFLGYLLIIELTKEPFDSKQLQELINNNMLLKEQLEKINIPLNPSRINWELILLFITPYLFSTVFFNFEARIAKENLYLILKATPTKQ